MAYAHPVRHLVRAKDLVDARYREPVDVKALAHAAKLSRVHFSRELGDSPHQYLLNRRLERAAASPPHDRPRDDGRTARIPNHVFLHSVIVRDSVDKTAVTLRRKSTTAEAMCRTVGPDVRRAEAVPPA